MTSTVAAPLRQCFTFALACPLGGLPHLVNSHPPASTRAVSRSCNALALQFVLLSVKRPSVVKTTCVRESVDAGASARKWACKGTRPLAFVVPEPNAATEFRTDPPLRWSVSLRSLGCHRGCFSLLFALLVTRRARRRRGGVRVERGAICSAALDCWPKKNSRSPIHFKSSPATCATLTRRPHVTSTPMAPFRQWV